MPRALFVAASLCLAVAAFAVGAASGIDTPRALATNAAATSLGLIALTLAGSAFSREPLERRLGWVPSGLSTGVIVGLVLGLLAVSQLAEWLIAFAGFEEVGQLPEIRRVLRQARDPVSLPLALVGVALLPGIAEEVALRGFVQRGLTPQLGAAGAVGLTSLLFGVLHGDPIHAAGAALLGVYLGAIVAINGSIRPAVLCHVANNAVATLGTAFPMPWITVAVAVAGAIAGPWALWRLVLHARAARPLLGESPEAAPPAPSSEGPTPPS